jgi:hypothetical protein
MLRLKGDFRGRISRRCCALQYDDFASIHNDSRAFLTIIAAGKVNPATILRIRAAPQQSGCERFTLFL